MRKITTLNEGDGKILVRYLQAQGIEVMLRADTSSADFELWVVDEEHCDTVREITTTFRKDPYAACYRNVTPPPVVKTPKRARYIDVRTQLFHQSLVRGKLTATMMTISVLVYLLQSLGLAPRFVALLYISEYVQPLFMEIAHGQVWRLVTPIFLHFGILHIIFNMLWLHSLGNQIEQLDGWRKLALLMLSISVVSNVGQYLVSGATVRWFFWSCLRFARLRLDHGTI